MRNFLFALAVVLFAICGLQNASAAEVNIKLCTESGVCGDLYKTAVLEQELSGDVGFTPRRLALTEAAATTPCDIYTPLGNGCVAYLPVVWFPIGGGWRPEIKILNQTFVPGTICPVIVGFQLVPYTPGPGVVQTATYTDNRDNLTPKTGEAGVYTLPSGESVDIRFSAGSTPGVTSLGGVQILYATGTQNPACLRALSLPQTRMTYRAPNGVVTSNLTEWVGKFGATVVAPISATTTISSTAGEDPAVAISNTTSLTEVVRVSLVDQNGKVVIATGSTTLPDITLTPFASNAFTFRSFFGTGMFPAGKDFTGKMVIEVQTTNGVVTAVPFSWIDGIIGSIEVTAF